MKSADVCATLDVKDARGGIGVDGEVVLLIILRDTHPECQVKCYSAVASEQVGQCLDEITILAILCPVPNIAAVLCGDREFAALRLVDGQEQGVDLCATIGVRVSVQVGAALSIGLPVAGSPDVVAAFTGSSRGVLRVVDSEMQSDNAVATGGSPAGDSVRGGVNAFVISLPVPGVAFAGGDGFHALGGYAGPHSDGDAGGCAGAAVRGAGDSVSGGSGGRHGDGIGAGACGPGVAVGTAGGECGTLIKMYGSAARDGHNGNGSDSQVQGVDLCATVGVRVAVQVCAALGVGLSVAGGPSVTAAFVGSGGGVLCVVNGKVQGDNAVASRGGPVVYGEGRGVCAGGVGGPVPGVAAAGGDGLHALSGYAGAHVDGDAGGCAGASVSVSGNGVGGGTGGRNGDGIGVCPSGPNIAVGAVCGERAALVEMNENVAGNGYSRDGLDGEVQGVHLCAAVGIGVAMEVGAALEVAMSVTGGPDVAVTLGDRGGVVLRVEDGEVQGIDLCTAVAVGVAVEIGAALGVGLPVAGSPGVAVALGNGEGCVLRMEDGEVQGDNTVASGGSPVGDGVRGGAAAVIGLPVPGETAAGGDVLHALRGDAGSHFDCDAGRRAGTSISLSSNRVSGGAGWRDGDGIGVRPGGPDIAVGAVCGERGALIKVYETIASDGHQRDGLDGEVQSVHLCASVGVRVNMKIVAALGVGVPVAGSPGVAVALGDGKGRVLRMEEGEVQSIDLRATIGVGVNMQIVAALGVGVPVAGSPGVAVALDYGK